MSLSKEQILNKSLDEDDPYDWEEIFELHEDIQNHAVNISSLEDEPRTKITGELFNTVHGMSIIGQLMVKVRVEGKTELKIGSAALYRRLSHTRYAIISCAHNFDDYVDAVFIL